jgi:dTDP-glucose 4,6-dehydratase
MPVCGYICYDSRNNVKPPTEPPMTEQRHYLVTGGAGFIGTNLVAYLSALEPHARITIVDKLNYASTTAGIDPHIDHERVSFIRADIADAAAMRQVFGDLRPTGVFHLAAESHVDRSISGPAPFIHSNIVGTFTLLECTREFWLGDRTPRRFLHVSTDEVYGSLEGDELFREDSRYDPSSPYSASKAASDHLARAYHRTWGIDVVITNCSNNFGPWQYPDKLVPLMIRNIRDQRPLPVYGDGRHVRDWLFVADHCDALKTVFERGRPGRSYNIGADCERFNIDVVGQLCDLVDDALQRERSSRSLIAYVTDRPGHDRRYGVDSTRLRTELGWAPRHPFDEALQATVNWYLDNLDRVW